MQIGNLLIEKKGKTSMLTLADLATRERILVSTSDTKAGGLTDLYDEENWGNPPLIRRKSDSLILGQPVGRRYTKFGLENRIAQGALALMSTYPNAIVFGGENGEFKLGKTPYDIGILGARVMSSPNTSFAYTGTSEIVRAWSEWVHSAEGREYGFLIQKLASNVVGEELIGQDLASLEKDPMGFRSLWTLAEYNRRRLYKYGFRAALAPLLNSKLYQEPPVSYTRKQLLDKLDQVRKHVGSQQRIPRLPIDDSKHLFVLASDNSTKYQGTLNGLQRMHQHGLLGRIAYEHILRYHQKLDFQLLAEDADVFGPDQPDTIEEIISMGIQRVQQKREKYSRALVVYGTQGGFVELGDVTFEAHYTPALGQTGQFSGEWTTFFPLADWFVWQVYELRTQASHLSQVYGGIGCDPIQLFSAGMRYNRAETIEISTMGATLLHAFPELHVPQPFGLLK